jgi:hypothetical protein
MYVFLQHFLQHFLTTERQMTVSCQIGQQLANNKNKFDQSKAFTCFLTNWKGPRELHVHVVATNQQYTKKT